MAGERPRTDTGTLAPAPRAPAACKGEFFRPQPGAGWWGSPRLQPLGSPYPLLPSPGRQQQLFLLLRQSREQSKLFSMSGCFSHQISESKQQSSPCIPTGDMFFAFGISQSPKKKPSSGYLLLQTPLPTTIPYQGVFLRLSFPSRMPQFPSFPPDPPPWHVPTLLSSEQPQQRA